MKVDIYVTTVSEAHKRSAVLKRLFQLSPNLSTIELVLGWNVPPHDGDLVLLSREVWEEMARLTRITEFSLEGEAVDFDDLHS